jgi:hypothetical protein
VDLSKKAQSFGVWFPLDVECAWDGRNCLSYYNPASIPANTKTFHGVMHRDGLIAVLGNGPKTPSNAMLDVRNVVEGCPPGTYRATGGWPYWHFRDVTGKLRPIKELK